MCVIDVCCQQHRKPVNALCGETFLLLRALYKASLIVRAPGTKFSTCRPPSNSSWEHLNLHCLQRNILEIQQPSIQNISLFLLLSNLSKHKTPNKINIPTTILAETHANYIMQLIPTQTRRRTVTEAYAQGAKYENFSWAVSLTVHTFQNKKFFVGEVVRRIRKIAKSDY